MSGGGDDAGYVHLVRLKRNKYSCSRRRVKVLHYSLCVHVHVSISTTSIVW